MLAARDGARRVLSAACAAAQAEGLTPGLSVAHARALVPGLVVQDADPAGDAEDLARLAAWVARRYSPLVAVDPPDGLWIDASGCAHLFGGEERMLDDLVGRCTRLGLAARAAMAETTGAAHALARFKAGPVTIIAPGKVADAIADLPIAALRLPAATVDKLRRLGLQRIRQLIGLPRAPLVHRFGAEVGRRLDQALGAVAEPINPLLLPEMPRRRISFAEPIGTAEAIEQAISDLATDLCLDLEAEGQGARRLQLLFHCIDGRTETIAAGTAKPSRDPAHLARLLSIMIDTVDPGFGIEAITLAAPLVERLGLHQIGIEGAGEKGEPDLAALIDKLMNRLGSRRLYRIAPVESDVPERAVQRVPPLAPFTKACWPPMLPRPTRLVSPPEPVDAMALLPDHPPTVFTYRGKRHRVVQADGPERIYGEWWRAEDELALVRDYFRVDDEQGHRFWLFRAGDGENPETGSMRWYLHGLFG